MIIKTLKALLVTEDIKWNENIAIETMNTQHNEQWERNRKW